MNIASLLTEVKQPDNPALIFSGRENAAITFRELDDLSSRLAAGMEVSGLQPGDRAIMLAPISLMVYAGLIALFKLGVTAVFLDPQTGIKQLNRAIELADARAFIGGRRLMWLRSFFPAMRRVPYLFFSEGDGAHSLQNMARTFPPRTEIADVNDDHPALITFTGGSTDSLPRGVLRTHRLLIEQHHALSRSLPMQTSDIDLPAFPVVVLRNLASGITSVIPDFPFRRPDAVQPEKILRQVESFGVTTASGSPSYWSAIIKYCLAHEKTLPLRRIVMGGAPTLPEVMKLLMCVAPYADIVNVYGSTEAEPVAKLCVEDLSDETIRSVEMGAGIPLGRVVGETCIRILDKNHHEQSVDTIGEIWVSGEHVARGYFENPKADAINKLFDSDGRLWHCMGDVGYMDEKGWLWLVGRINTVINRAGRMIYPVPVETVVETLPFVQRAALIGIRDDLLSERVVLVFEFAKDIGLPVNWREQIQSLLTKRSWVVDEVRLMGKLPVDARHNARIDYQKLKSIFIQTRPLSLWERVRG